MEAERSRLTNQMTISLAILFMLFVVWDLVSTAWLITNDPYSVANEANPIGVYLYTNFGFGAMILVKAAYFVVLSAMVIIFTAKFYNLKWFVETSQTITMSLSGYSLVVGTNNFLAIVAVHYVTGVWPIVEVPRWVILLGMLAGSLALASAFTNGLLYFWGLKKRTDHLKIFVGLFLFLAPQILFIEGFKAYPWLFIVYVISVSSALGLAYYIGESNRPRSR